MNLSRRSKLVLLAFAASAAALLLLFFFETDALARVGGGQSYGGGRSGGSRGGSGGSGGGSGDGGAIIWLLFQAIRMLAYLTVQHPLVGIPLDIILIGSVVVYFKRRATRGIESDLV